MKKIISIFNGCNSCSYNINWMRKNWFIKSSEIVTELTGPVSIEMWHYMTGKQSEVLQSIVDDFNANNGKGITVTALSQGAIPDLNKDNSSITIKYITCNS